MTGVLAAEVRPGWRPVLLVLAAALALTLTLYRETAGAMVAIWMRSDTFAHGFLVPFISLWLIWRDRVALSRRTPQPNAWFALLVAASGFAWLLGDLAAVGPLSQFALVGMIVGVVTAVLGWRMALDMGFPLAFVLFAVPFGEFALPQLMEWTANVTIWGLRLSGVPVYREGLHFVIPTGQWSVVEACSGVRYLIASLMVGTLFAYLNYRSLIRRLVFIGVSFFVPIAANWMRAYIIVMLGHLSGNRLAAGVDHLIYGWLFFGIVILSMFWIGARWREDELPRAASLDDLPEARKTSLPHLGVAMVAVVVMLSVWPVIGYRLAQTNGAAQTVTVPPLDGVPGWAPAVGGLPEWTPQYTGASAVLRQEFVRDGRTVGLYVGYYRNQDDQRKLVSTGNALVKSTDASWIALSAGRQIAPTGSGDHTVRTAALRSRSGERLAVWQWYWINGRLTASDATAKALTALHLLTGQGDDSAVVMIYTPVEEGSDTDALLADFSAAAAASIASRLNGVRDVR